MRYTIDGRLFARKLAVLFAGTFLFVPLLYLKHHGLALAYLAGLLVLHSGLLYTWLHHVSWRQLLRYKAEFVVRVVAIMFFVYLLSLVHFEGNLLIIVRNTMFALMVHVGILLGLMLHRVPPARNSRKRINRSMNVLPAAKP